MLILVSLSSRHFLGGFKAQFPLAKLLSTLFNKSHIDKNDREIQHLFTYRTVFNAIYLL